MYDNIKRKLVQLKVDYILKHTRSMVLRKYDKVPSQTLDEYYEYKQATDFLRRYGTGGIPYPYEFPRKYSNVPIDIRMDPDGLQYVIRNGKRLYGKRKWTDVEYRDYYRGLLVEQDLESPHCYISNKNRLPENGGGYLRISVQRKASLRWTWWTTLIRFIYLSVTLSG